MIYSLILIRPYSLKKGLFQCLFYFIFFNFYNSGVIIFFHIIYILIIF